MTIPENVLAWARSVDLWRRSGGSRYNAHDAAVADWILSLPQGDLARVGAERDAALQTKNLLWGVLKRRGQREAELRLREVVVTKPLHDEWGGVLAQYGKAPTGSAMRRVVDTGEALIRAQIANEAALQQALVDARALMGEVAAEAAARKP